MAHIIRSLKHAVLMVGLVGGPLAAQAPGVAVEFKGHFGYAPVTRDHLRPASMALGVAVERDTPLGRAGVEAGLFYKTGDFYLQDIADAPADKQALDTVQSADRRRTGIEGLALRFSLARPVCEGVEWQVGLMLGGSRFTQEYFGDIRGKSWNAQTPNSWRDIYEGRAKQNALGLSPFVGLRWEVSRKSRLELNLLIHNYKASDLSHAAGQGTYKPSTIYAPGTGAPTPGGLIADFNAFPADTTQVKNRFVPHVELGYAFRLN